MAGEKEAFAEVAGYDLFGVADRREIDARIPAHQYIDVHQYTSEQRLRIQVLVFAEEWGEQLGNASGGHGGGL